MYCFKCHALNDVFYYGSWRVEICSKCQHYRVTPYHPLKSVSREQQRCQKQKESELLFETFKDSKNPVAKRIFKKAASQLGIYFCD